MMTGYTKLFSSLVGSTIWREPDHVRLVWITMLALKNRFHEVEASIPGLADFARVPLDKCIEALEILKAPDAYSRTKDNEGRRIEEIDGGWRILNGEKYRNAMNQDERRDANRIYQRKFREKKKATLKTGKRLPGESAYLRAIERGDGSEEKVLEAMERNDAERENDEPSALI